MELIDFTPYLEYCFIGFLFRMFLVKQLDYLQPYLEELIPTNKKAFLSQFFSQVTTQFSILFGGI